MPSFYAIVQYVPDPVADERLNVGVIAFGDGMILTRFVKNWSRVKLFGGSSVSFLREFVSIAANWAPPQIAIPGVDDGVHLSPEEFRRLSGKWINSIQFTEPKASLLTVDETLKAAGRFLTEPPSKHRGFRDRRVAISVAFRGLTAAITEAGGDVAAKAVEKNYKVRGSLDEHRFDLAIHNGKPLLAAQCISFEGPVSKDLEREVDAAAWSIDDVLRADPNLSVGVVTLPPKSKSKIYDRAVYVFEGLHATVVAEGEVPVWASTTSKAIGPALKIAKTAGSH